MPWGRSDLAPLLVAPTVVLVLLLSAFAVVSCWAVRTGMAHGMRDARRADRQADVRAER